MAVSFYHFIYFISSSFWPPLSSASFPDGTVGLTPRSTRPWFVSCLAFRRTSTCCRSTPPTSPCSSRVSFSLLSFCPVYCWLPFVYTAKLIRLIDSTVKPLFPDGRHFKAVYGKDLVESLLSASDSLMVEREKSVDDQLCSQRNSSATLQGQINLLRSHQAHQDRRLNYSVAREAEDADGRANERFV